MNDEIIERALEAYHTWMGGPAWKPHDEYDRDGSISQMQAVANVVIEECARVALTVQDSGDGLMSIQIAAAIRALKDKK